MGQISAEAQQQLGPVWRQLVALMALGPAPAVRACPSCGRVGMAEAHRCGHCWVALAPLPVV